MNTLVFIRHGETALAGTFCGHSDPEINPAGQQQIAACADAIARLDVRRIYSSDLRRAVQTAEIIGKRISVPVVLRPDLREINFGDWEGLSWLQVEDRFPLEADQWLQEFPLRCAPGGEVYSAFTTRINAVIAPLLTETSSGTSALVTHRGVICYALKRFFGFSEQEAWMKTVPYGAVVVAGNHQ